MIWLTDALVFMSVSLWHPDNDCNIGTRVGMQQTNAMDYVYHVGRLSKQCSNLLLV
jgi:hypothetical protein